MISFRYRPTTAERGQAVVESVFFLPVLLLSLFGLFYFSRLGVLDERAQLAVRFGGNIAYQAGKPFLVATLQDVLNSALNPSQAQFAVLCTGTGGSTNYVQQSTADALTQNQGNPSSTAGSANTPYAGPSAAPFWNPTGTVSPSCSPSSLSLHSSPSSPVIPASQTGISISGNVPVPVYLAPLYGNASTTTFNAQWNVVNVALPSQLLVCNVPLLSIVEVVVGRTGSPTATC